MKKEITYRTDFKSTSRGRWLRSVVIKHDLEDAASFAKQFGYGYRVVKITTTEEIVMGVIGKKPCP